MKRVALFVLTNLAVILMLGSVVRLLGLHHYLSAQGIDYAALLGFSAVLGFSGALISLLLSRPMARWTTGARVLDARATPDERWLRDTVAELSRRAGIACPQVAVYEGAPNAFATGAFRNHALVAVSTGLLETMSREEVEAVLGHEIAHVANGDMVTLALLQGVLNTFVIFFARVMGVLVDRALHGGNGERRTGVGFHVAVLAGELVFGLLASLIVMAYSRHREYRADRGCADLLGTPRPMIAALARLGGLASGHLPASLRAMGIDDAPAWVGWLSSHPPIERRIAALRAPDGLDLAPGSHGRPGGTPR